MRLSNFIIEIPSSAIDAGSDNDTPVLVTKGSELIDRRFLFASGLQRDSILGNIGTDNPVISLIAGNITFTALDILEQNILSSGTVRAGASAISFGTIIVAAGINEG